MRTDKEEFAKCEQEILKMELKLDLEQKAHIARLADREIAEGRLKESERQGWTRNAEDSQLLMTREWMLQKAAEESRKSLRVPGEPDIIANLLKAKNPEEIREICADAFTKGRRETEPGVFRDVMLPNWTISVGSPLPSYLSEYATEFIAGRKDPRFPKSTRRPSSRLKQLWFLSRALAGALYGVRTRTVINLVGSKRPEEVFEESRAAKPLRKRARHLRSGLPKKSRKAKQT
jgi:hypothetical protein